MSVINERSLRVLLVTDCADVYGAERWNAQVAVGLQTKGHSVAIAQPTAYNDVTREIGASGIRQYWTAPLLGGHLWRIFAPDGPDSVEHRSARDVIGDARPDVIVFSDGEPGSNLPAKEVAGDAGIPAVTVSHLGDDVTAKERMLSRDVRARIALAINNSRAVVGVSRSNVSSLVAAFDLDPSRTHVVPNGRPLRFFERVEARVRNASRTALGVTDEQVLFVTLARPHPNKQYSIQIDALCRLQSHAVRPFVHFAWAGDGPALDRLRAIVRLKQLADIVTTCGYVEDVAGLLGAADAFVLPSSREGAPLAVIEAMGAGLPVIASNVGGVADLLGDTGILLPDPNDSRAATVDALYDSIVQVASDQALRRRLGAAARARAVAQFGEDQMIDRYDALIRAAVKS